MGMHYWITDDGEVASRLDGNPWSDDFFHPLDLNRWIMKKRREGAEITFVIPPRVEVWGGPHEGHTWTVRVIAEVDVK